MLIVDDQIVEVASGRAPPPARARPGSSSTLAWCRAAARRAPALRWDHRRPRSVGARSGDRRSEPRVPRQCRLERHAYAVPRLGSGASAARWAASSSSRRWLWATGVTPCRPCRAPRPRCRPRSSACLRRGSSASRSPGSPIRSRRIPLTEEAIGLAVQNGAQRSVRARLRGTNPGPGIYLVRDWAGYGEILARLEPLPIPPDEARGPTHRTKCPAHGPARDRRRHRHDVDELVGRVLDGTLGAGSFAIASIPSDAVSDPPDHGLGARTYPCDHPVPDARRIRVHGVAKNGIVGVQAFLVEPAGTVLALGQAATGPTGSALEGTDVLPKRMGVARSTAGCGSGRPCLPEVQDGPRTQASSADPLSWSQCPEHWILPSADDPWAGPPNSVQATDGSGIMTIGDRSVPERDAPRPGWRARRRRARAPRGRLARPGGHDQRLSARAPVRAATSSRSRSPASPGTSSSMPRSPRRSPTRPSGRPRRPTPQVSPSRREPLSVAPAIANPATTVTAYVTQ